ncbi:class I SAM-dependent methyltransferase [Radicibacter daui]|uniref:class I SAM-dependent methyltransferase n=1 Tax=Radicibacter daui TaxID=3064829 RepID=UPI004046BD19
MPPVSPALDATLKRMEHYHRKLARSVSGWLAPESAEVVTHIAGQQITAGLKGGVGEIGIHHGKLFLLLYLSLQEDERSFALDVFEDQQFNIDASGLGDRGIFMANLARVGGDERRVSVFAQDSCSVTAADLAVATGPLRLMSVDGGHTEEITHNDMRLGEELLLDDGVLVLDDVYQERWPAVAAGAFRFVLEPGRQLRPFAISPNKTYFCKSPSAAARYRGALAEAFPELRLGEVTMFGSEVLILGRRTLVNRVRNHPLVKDNPALYRRLSALLHKLR